jgi:hypothetical protein
MPPEAPIGSIVAFAGRVGGENVPANWLVCDGRLVSNVTFPRLFAVIGTSWGGDGTPNFCLPDLRGRFLRGVDRDQGGQPTAPPRDPDRDVRPAASTIDPTNPGNDGNNVGSSQDEDFHSHKHVGIAAVVGPPNTFNNKYNQVGTFAFDNSGTGESGGNETRPKNSYVWWIIRAS